MPPTASATPTSGRPNVQIACILFDGGVPRTESDEYVEIVNQGDAPQDMMGWTLVDISDGAPPLVFGAESQLEPGGIVRVYTNETHPEWGGLSFGSASAVWNNTYADTAGLRNPDGRLVSIASYDPDEPPGCQ